MKITYPRRPPTFGRHLMTAWRQWSGHGRATVGPSSISTGAKYGKSLTIHTGRGHVFITSGPSTFPRITPQQRLAPSVAASRTQSEERARRSNGSRPAPSAFTFSRRRTGGRVGPSAAKYFEIFTETLPAVGEGVGKNAVKCNCIICRGKNSTQRSVRVSSSFQSARSMSKTLLIRLRKTFRLWTREKKSSLNYPEEPHRPHRSAVRRHLPP